MAYKAIRSVGDYFNSLTSSGHFRFTTSYFAPNKKYFLNAHFVGQDILKRGHLEEFEQYAEYNMNGAYQAGSVLNNLAIHARDSVPVMGIPVSSASSADPDSRIVSVVTVWNKYDIDGDGDLELVEIIYSGSYIISAREVEFIPVANMCPKPLPGNFYGMSIAESVIPMQEYQINWPC